MNHAMLAHVAVLLTGTHLAGLLVGDIYVDAQAISCATANGTPAAPFCTITEALAVAVDGDSVLVAPGIYTENIIIDDSIALIGRDGATVTTIDGGGLGTVVEVSPGVATTVDGFTITAGIGVVAGGIRSRGTLTLLNSTVAGNIATGGGYSGAGLTTSIGGHTTVRDSTFDDNFATGAGPTGGAIFIECADLTMERSTVSANRVNSPFGAAVYLYDCNFVMRNSTITANTGSGISFYEYGASGQLYDATITESTIVGNTTGFLAAGIEVYGGGPVYLRDTIIAGNIGGTGRGDLNGQFDSLGHNLIGDGTSGSGFTGGVNGDLVGSAGSPIDPMLAGLADNGGLTWTHALLAGSPAIDAGDPAMFAPRDQRGVARPTGYVDIGAFEAPVGSSIPGCVPVPNATGSVSRLAPTASLVVPDNEFHLTMLSLPRFTFGYLLTSRTQGNVAQPGGSQGVFCLGGAVGRFIGPGQIGSSGSEGTIGLQIDLTMHPTPTGLIAVLPGETWNFQGWHRDSVNGAATSNFTEGVTVTFF